MAAANNEFFEALSMLEHERGITAEYLIEKIKAAIVIAVKKNYEVEDDNVMVEIDPATGKFNVALLQNVVADEDWYDEHAEIGLTEAQKLRKSYEIGDRVVTPLKTKDFGRIAAQTAKHVIRQGIREAERSQQLSEIQSRAHDIIQATVTRVDNEKGIVALDLGKGGEAILPRNEQVPGEVYTEGETLQVYVVDVVSGERGARVMISRTHPGLVKRLFELEVPEIYDGTVEVKAISREAGARTKMAVWSKDPNVNPVSACIGPHGDRVAAVVEKLGGEKIDIVKWSEDVSEFISAALSPAKVLKVELLPGETRSCRVTVPDQQLSLAIGNKGQNARLCARLTGYNIDIRPESGYYGWCGWCVRPAARSASTSWAKSPAAEPTSARTRPVWPRQRRKRRWSAALSSRFPPKCMTHWPRSWPVLQRRQSRMAKHKNNTLEKPVLPPQEALYQAVSLCRKAGALTMGFDAVEDACVKGKAWLVMVASDASAKTVQRLNYAVGDLVDVITMPLTQDRLADISRKPVAVYAVTDRNLAKLCFDRLSDCGAIKNEEDMSE